MLSRPIIFFLLIASLPAAAQMPGMTMSAQTLAQAIQQHGSSGTSIEPASTPVPMILFAPRTTGVFAGWQLMLHANAFAANTQQQATTQPGAFERNRDAFFSTNWIMPMAQRAFGPERADGVGTTGGLLTLRTMLSFEPATVGARNYPELFQQGETAYGKPIIDGQHPHDFFMEVAALYDLPLSRNTLLSLYAAPIGDPAIGPTAYPHRASASEDPIAALGHHQEDSTHIAFNVVTGGLTYRWARVELSGFHGAEPDEARWHFQPSPNGHAIDSVSTRLTVSPTPDWSGQYSFAHIHAVEALSPQEDQQRQTASVMYHHTFRSQPMPPMKMSSSMSGMDMPGMQTPTKPFASHAAPPMHMVAEPCTDLSTTLLWGRTHALDPLAPVPDYLPRDIENSYLAEALLRFAHSNYVWTRLENAGRSNELLLTPSSAVTIPETEAPIGHVAAYTFGYDHDIPVGKHLLAAPGVQFTVYRTPSMLVAEYGSTPTAETFFIRFRLH